MRVLGSITNRIFLASALLAMLSIGAAVYFVSARMTTQTELDLQGDLTEAATLVDDQRRTQFDNFTRTARLIADLPKFKAVVEIADPPTLAPIASDYLAQAGADLFMVTGRKGERLALAVESGANLTSIVAADQVPAEDRKAVPAFWAHPAGVLEVVSVLREQFRVLRSQSGGLGYRAGRVCDLQRSTAWNLQRPMAFPRLERVSLSRADVSRWAR